MNRLNAMQTVLLILALGMVVPTLSTQTATSQQVGQGPNRVLVRNAAILAGNVTPRPKEMMLSGAMMAAYAEATGGANAAATLAAAAPAASDPGGVSRRTLGCQNVFPGPFPNIRVNQDCSLRRQAEEVVVIDPFDSSHVIAGQNDSRLGFNHCGYDFSFNRGRTWGDMLPPFWQFVMADGHTADACSDPTATFDDKGNAYIAGVLFDVGAAASALVVAKSNAAYGGTFYHAPNSALTFQAYRTTPLGVVASDNNPNIIHDKEFINADSSSSSPKKGNVYATWARFNLDTGAGVGADSPIYFSQSTDGGATWSPGIEISGANAATCTIFSGETNVNACDQDQGAWPEIGPDGTLYVSFFNGNTPLPGINQWLMTKCPASANCALPASWTTPVKITDDIGGQPLGPNAATACPGGGRSCLPPNGYRIQDETYGVNRVDPSRPGRIFFMWSDFRNGGAPCTGPAATATPPCDQDVFLVRSDNGGATWSAPVNVTPASKFGKSAQWQPWMAVGPDGKVYIAYYDRSYGSCETTGCNDITLAVSYNAGGSSPTFAYYRITTSSMPNLVPANNPIQAGFLGDYMWVAADKRGALIVWGDTRGRNGAVEEDIYFARFPRGDD